jgi:hypothetical protein
LAVALVEKEMANMRAFVSGAVYRCAAKAGHDIAKLSGINTSIKDDIPIIELVPADLVDQAQT